MTPLITWLLGVYSLQFEEMGDWSGSCCLYTLSVIFRAEYQMIVDYQTMLQLTWILSALNLVVSGAKVRGMCLGESLVFYVPNSVLAFSSFPSLLFLLTPYTHRYILHLCTHICIGKHIQSSLSLSQTNTSRAQFFFSPQTCSYDHPNFAESLWEKANMGPWKMHFPLRVS